jgi:adenylate cyclase
MAIEIERKFLLKDDTWRPAVTRSTRYRQGYLSTDPARTIRIRIAGPQATLTIKGLTTAATRAEFEVPLPLADANQMLDTLCLRPLIDKTRHLVPFAGMTWEIDEFHAENLGLLVAEIELPSENHVFSPPPWLGPEVTHDPRYFNSHLSLHPYTTWR